jgi:hypothetical protein
MASKLPFDTKCADAYGCGMSKTSASGKTSVKPRGKAKPLAIPARASAPAVKPRLGAHAGLTASTGSAAVRAKTLRLIPEFEAGLGILKNILRKPVNKMVNEAVGEYIEKRAAEVETDLRGVLEKLKAYKRADPRFASARAQFVEAEARYGADDPAEGVVFDIEPPQRKAGKSKMGPSQAMVRKLLRS